MKGKANMFQANQVKKNIGLVDIEKCSYNEIRNSNKKL